MCRNCSIRCEGSISEMCMEGPLKGKGNFCEKGGLSQLYREVSVLCVGRVLRSVDRGPPEVYGSGALICVERYQVCSRNLCGCKWLLSV